MSATSFTCRTGSTSTPNRWLVKFGDAEYVDRPGQNQRYEETLWESDASKCEYDLGVVYVEDVGPRRSAVFTAPVNREICTLLLPA